MEGSLVRSAARYAVKRCRSSATAGVSIGQALDDLDAIAAEALPGGVRTAYGGLSLEYKSSSSTLYFMFLLAIGLLIGLYKMFTLFTMGGAMRKTAKTRQAGDGNPLARLFETFEQNRGSDIETLELKLDEQILRESPRIERFNDIVKVLSAVSPLLGLLGTVIGMIITFTSITIYGAGDPKLMAGGISVALMTTVFGLVSAIPLLLVHAIIASMARGNQQILDEQAAGLIAEKAESLRGAA